MAANVTGENVSDPGDPCNSYEWSIVFCFIMALAIIAWLIAIALVSKTSNKYLSNFVGK